MTTHTLTTWEKELARLLKHLRRGSSEECEVIRSLARRDLYFLLTEILNRADLRHPWLYQRCREVEATPDGCLDLWARDHRKSSIITFGLTIQDILANHGESPPGRWAAAGIAPTFGLFSHTRPSAKKFLRWIKLEFETNDKLRGLFPDIFWTNPGREAPKWSEDDGIVVKREQNPKEATVEAWGIIDAQPTGAHFTHRVYDDVVERRAVQTVDAMRRTRESWELSLNLGTRGGVTRYIGTRYHFLDTYGEMIQRGSVRVRRYPATADGSVEGAPVLLTREELAEKRRDMGSFTYACQMLQDPRADAAGGFNKEDMRWYESPPKSVRRGLNVYMLVDPASEKKRSSDYTALNVIGLGADRNFYVLDMVRDRLNLRERAQLVLEKHRDWQPNKVGYERYGMQADIEYLREVQERENYRFQVLELGGGMGNLDRVRRLQPTWEEGRWHFPVSLPYVDYEDKRCDMVETLVNEEVVPFPVGMHADMLDSMSRIFDEDMGATFPKANAAPLRQASTSWVV